MWLFAAVMIIYAISALFSGIAELIKQIRLLTNQLQSNDKSKVHGKKKHSKHKKRHK